MTDLIRSACLTHFAEVARSAGLDPIAMLRRARLPLASLDRQDMRIAVAGVRRLLEASAAASGVETFGLRLAERDVLSNFGPLALLVREQATVGTALETLSRFIHIHSEGMRFAIERHDDVATVVLLPRGRALRQATEFALGTLARIIGFLYGDHWRPLDVHFMHSAPRHRHFHRRFFGSDITFDSDFDGMVCAASDMDRPIPTADPRLARYAQSRVEVLDDTRGESWDVKVGELVRTLLSRGDCRIERVAEHFACDRRTIHRRLADCGTSFSEILDNQRAELAARLIKDRARPLGRLAELLGFSAQSAMARWFRQRFGCSITQWRRGVKKTRREDSERQTRSTRPRRSARRPSSGRAN